MAEENESASGKKHRIIHWNPDAGREQARRHWTWKRILAWTVGGFFALLFVAAIGIRLIKLVLGPDVFSPTPEVVAGAPTLAEANSAFVSQAKAEQARELSSKAMVGLRKLPQDHPLQFQRLVLIEKSFMEADALLVAREFGRAFRAFDIVNQDIAAYSENVKIKGDAKQSYDAIILRIRELEVARDLAPGMLDQAFEMAGTGRQLLTDGNFTGAKKLFDKGFADLKTAEDALAEYVRSNLLAGQRAISKGERATAIKAFQTVMEKSPGNELALQGMKRAETSDQVFALIQKAQAQEKESQFLAAVESYRKAFALDSFSAVAQEGQTRAARLEKEVKFAAAQTAAQAAFKRKEWSKAIAEAEAALKVYAQKPEMQTLLKSAKENAHKDAVQTSLAKAFAFENEHQWKEARDGYEATLQLEPQQADAKDGFTRAGTMIRALLQYDRLIESAEQLANKSEFQGAIRRFNDAMAIKPAYLANTEKIQQLHALLMAQNQPVEVTFKGDGKTWVQISTYKMLGQIDTKVEKVLPGDYTVIGRRRGYDDVLMLLQVRNGTPPPTVTVSCNIVKGKI